jgi:hypothetical protein
LVAAPSLSGTETRKVLVYIGINSLRIGSGTISGRGKLTSPAVTPDVTIFSEG